MLEVLKLKFLDRDIGKVFAILTGKYWCQENLLKAGGSILMITDYLGGKNRQPYKMTLEKSNEFIRYLRKQNLINEVLEEELISKLNPVSSSHRVTR
jgi:hypothetical protein